MTFLVFDLWLAWLGDVLYDFLNWLHFRFPHLAYQMEAGFDEAEQRGL